MVSRSDRVCGYAIQGMAALAIVGYGYQGTVEGGVGRWIMVGVMLLIFGVGWMIRRRSK